MAPARKASTEVEPVDEQAEIDVYELINKQAQGPLMPTTWGEFVDSNTGELIEFEGSPWAVIKKEALLDVPFIIADVRVYKGKYGDPVVAVMCVTETPLPGTEKAMYVFNDGSTGVYEQVVGMIKTTGKKSGIICKKGLRKSDYTYTEHDSFEGTDKEIPATTYYVA